MTTFAPAVESFETSILYINNNPNTDEPIYPAEIMRLAELFEDGCLVTYFNFVLFEAVCPDPAGEILRLAHHLKEVEPLDLTRMKLWISASVAKTGKSRSFPITEPFIRFATSYPIEKYPIIPNPRDDADALRSPETRLKNALVRFRNFYRKQTGRTWIRDGLRKAFKHYVLLSVDGFYCAYLDAMRDGETEEFTQNPSSDHSNALDAARFWIIAPTGWPECKIKLEHKSLEDFYHLFTQEEKFEMFEYSEFHYYQILADDWAKTEGETDSSSDEEII